MMMEQAGSNITFNIRPWELLLNLWDTYGLVAVDGFAKVVSVYQLHINK